MVMRVLGLVLFGFALGVGVETYQPTLGEGLALMWLAVGIELTRRVWRS